MTTNEIRSLLAEIEAFNSAEAAEAQSLTAEIAVLARWTSRHIPTIYRQPPTLITDEPGSGWDRQYPPDEHVALRDTRRMLRVWESTTTEEPTSDGYYYSYTIHSAGRGLLIGKDGTLYREIESGSAALGQYNSHPGTCDRRIAREITPLHTPSIGALRAAAKLLVAIRAVYLDPSIELASPSDDEDVEVTAAKSPRATSELLLALADRSGTCGRARKIARERLDQAAQAA